jgi:hypothetical protein
MARMLKDLTTDFINTDMPLRQAIVNTHSPVLVNEMIKWKNDENVSVHFSQMRTRITEVEGTKIKMNVTIITPVLKDFPPQTTIVFSEQDRKLTIATIKEYLQTADFENTIKTLDSK